jgi:two-component system chemotaxis sensor kinase CheA
MNDLLAQFVAEARDLLREAGEDLLALERTPNDEHAINRLFRSVHTLKGSSGLFDVPPLTSLLHAAEDLFQAVREHGLTLTPEMVDLVLRALDQTGVWVDRLDQHETLPADAAGTARALVAELRARFGRRPGEPLHRPNAAPAADPDAPPPELAKWFAATTLRAAAARAGAAAILLVSYRPEAGCFFRGEDPLHLALQTPLALALGVQPRGAWGPLEDFDPFACRLDLHVLSTAGRAEIEALFRYVPDQVTITDLTAATLIAASAGGGADGAGGHAAATPDAAASRDARARTGADEGLPAVARSLLREQINLLDIAAPEEEFAGRAAAAGLVAANALRFAGRAAAAARVERGVAEALDSGRAERLLEAIADALGAEEAPAATAAPRPPPAAETAERAAPRMLRVDQEKVDALMNLVGELVVAKNSLPFLARRAEQHHGLRELGREIKDQYAVIDRIAQELQASVMAVRMMPVGQVFQRFPRLVRDLSRKLGKQVELAIEGEDTEADKNVIENLFDPLLHMVRNSLDHGVEPPEERIALGKPGAATLRLLARHDADQVVIEVADDGRGIDPAAVKRKAYERGLLDEARLASIGDEDARMLVFAPGFSTAERISDVSGRGVGLDVVRAAVEKAGGRVTLTSAVGAGTTVRLNLPLSMAVSRVMTVLLDDRLFGIPMDLIRETVKTPRRGLLRLRGREAFVLRDHVVPLARLARLLDLPDPDADSDEIAVLVVRVGGQTIGLGISAFGEGMEVILKPLGGMLGRIAGYAGTALLGDGRVLLVLDLKGLLS